MTNAKKTLIVLLGNIASGKTSTSRWLKKHLNVSTIMADNLFQTKNPYRQNYLKDVSKWAFTNEVWMTVNRYQLIMTKIKKNPGSHLVIDSGLLMNWVYSYSHLYTKVFSKIDWQLYEQIYELCRFSDFQIKVIYLSYSINTLLNRLLKRGRQYELDYYNKAYLQQIQIGLNGLNKKLKRQNIPIFVLEEKLYGDFLKKSTKQEKLLKRLRLFINNKKGC